MEFKYVKPTRRAIIDATALKEAALKNAENLVIEKYSEEVKAAMQTLLEQDEDPLAAMGDLAPGLGEEDPLADGAATPEPIEETSPDAEDDSLTSQIPLGTDPDLADPDDEIINIKLDSLRAEFPEEEDGVFGGDDTLDDNEIGIDITDEEDDLDLDLGLEDEEVDLNSDLDLGGDIETDPTAAISPEMVAEVLDEMDLDEEIDLEEIMEAVRVDFEPQKSGWAGTPEAVMQNMNQCCLQSRTAK